MALSYGTITIVDNTDLGQLSAFLSTDKYKEQIADTNDNPTTYNPDWSGNDGIIISPTVYYNGTIIDIATNGVANPQLTIVWYEDGIQVGGSDYPSGGPASALSNNTCKRIGNLPTTGTRHAVYRADITYYPVVGDPSLFLRTSASIELSCVTVGTNGQPGTPAKSLQLTSSRAYFTYRATGDLYGERTSTLTATKSDSINSIKWFYLNSSGSEVNITNKIANNGNTSAFTGLSFSLSPDNAYQSALFEVLNAKGQLSIYIKETNSSGTVVSGGFTDYVSIFKYQEASAGDSVYIASLNNDEETISVYNNNPDLSGAVTQFFVTKGGLNDLSNWHVTVTDNVASADNLKYVVWNTLDVPDAVLLGISTTTITANGTQAPTINGVSIATSTLTTNSMVIYGATPVLYKWNGSKWIQPSTNNLTKYGPDKLAVTALDVDYTAEITFTAQHGSYSGSTFTPDSGEGAIANLIKTFTIKKNASIISHSLRLDSVSLNRSSEGVYNPSTITINAIERTGGSSTPSDYHPAGVLKYTIYYTDNTTTTGSNNTDAPIELNFTSITKPISKIITTLGASAPYEDTQTITVSNDGTSPYNINVLNPSDTISTTYDYKPNSSYIIDVPFVVMQGGNELNVNVYQSASTAYPRVKTSVIHKVINGTDSSTGVTPSFYYDNESRASGVVNKAKATLGTSLNIGESGYFDLTFELSSSFSKNVRYTYSSSPEALNPLILHLYPTPADKFVNQTGAIVIEPTLYSGNDLIPSNIKYKWEIYIDGHWKVLKNKALSSSEASSTNPYYYHDENNNIFYSTSNNISDTISTISGTADFVNDTANSKYLHVFGAAVQGYSSFRLTATYETTNKSTVQQIALTDIDDPIQVKVLSTVGEKIVNHQGVGVIYAKVSQNNEEIDPVASKLVVSSVAPTNSDNTGVFKDMLGCVYKNGNTLTYFSRTATTGTGADWQERTSTRGDYHWTFRDKDNESIVGTETGLSAYLAYIITNNVNTQFIYVDSDVIDNKITADVRVTI